MNRFAAQWFEVERIFSPAVKREKAIDLRKNVDWETLEQIVLGGAVSTGCSIIEAAGLKSASDHVKILFELRNAFIHNQCDISKNRNGKALEMSRMYLANNQYRDLSPEIHVPFFRLDGNIVRFHENILFVIRLCLL